MKKITHYNRDSWIAIGLQISYKEIDLVKEMEQWCKEHTTTFMHIQYVSGSHAVARFISGGEPAGKQAKLDAMHFKLKWV